jgi:putative ABC transport system permease protein
MGSPSMLIKNIRIALRRLRHQAGVASIDVLGLAVGIAACLVIGLYVRHELSYDRFHENADRIVRVTTSMPGFDESLVMPAVAAPRLAARFAEIEDIARFFNIRQVVLGEEPRVEDAFYYTDPAAFRIFDFEVLQGDPVEALARPGTMAITESAAALYFGDADPMGRTVRMRGGQEFEVAALLRDLPGNSHMHFNMLGSFATLGEITDPWQAAAYTYVLLSAPHARSSLLAGLGEVAEAGFEAAGGLLGFWVDGMRFGLQPITDIHLHSVAGMDFRSNGDVRYVYIFGAIALLILLLALFNHVNLATARATRRAAEVSVRRVMGAGRSQLVRQFLGEALVTVAIAFVLAVVLAALALPLVEPLVHVDLTAGIETGLRTQLLAGLLVMALGLIAGAYPALVLSRAEPRRASAGRSGGREGAHLRRTMVAAQFAVTIGLIASTFVIRHQLEHVREMRLGFDREHVVTLPLQEDARRQPEAFRVEMERLPGVLRASVNSGTPVDRSLHRAVERDGEPITVSYPSIDFHYLETLGISLVEGRNFDAAFGADEQLGVLVTEAARKQLGWNVGDRITAPRRNVADVEVIGVVEDFHFRSVREPAHPAVLYIEPYWHSRIILRLAPGDVTAALSDIRSVWSRFVDDYPFTYAFLDDEFEALLEADRGVARIIGAFSLLAIGIACLGLFGLAAFMAQERTKEIGVRKILGAPVSSLVAMLSGEYLKLVVAGFLVAAPVAYLAMDRWLAEFAVRAELGPGIFLTAGILTAAVALLTVGQQALRAALADPVKSLRYE